MEKKIKLYYNIGRYEQCNKYIKIDEPITFNIEYEVPSGAILYYVASNGKETKRGIVENNKYILPASFVKVGKISQKIEVVILGEVVKTFTVEDLIIYENDNRINSIPEIDKLKELVSKLDEKCDVLTKLVGGIYDLDIKIGGENE